MIAMKYQKEFLKMIVLAAKSTTERELTCDECWKVVDTFAEIRLAGKDAAEAMPLIQDHLDKCPECTEELQALIDALCTTSRLSGMRSNTG